MKTRIVLFALSIALLAFASGCLGLSAEQQDKINHVLTSAGSGAAAIAPALPGPIGGIVAAGGAVLTLIGGLFAGRARSAAMAAGPDAAAALNPLTKILAERKWLFPTVGAIIAAGNAANLWHVDIDKLLALLAALGLPAAAEFAKDAMTAGKPLGPPAAGPNL